MPPVQRSLLAWIAGGLGLLSAAILLPGTLSIWVDEDGRPVLTNRDDLPPGVKMLRPDELLLRPRAGESNPPTPRSSSRDEDRFRRELLAARDDIRRGELKRGLRTLRRMQREHPARPEPAWLLARVERKRGRLEAAREALGGALRTAAKMPDEWREAAQALRREIDEELEHARSSPDAFRRTEVTESQHFRLAYDHRFAGRSYGERVLGMLELARRHFAEEFGATLERTLEVRLYTRAQYLAEYEHRFGFATVGFYDGVIHVVSARHPRGELYALLVHEYAHALFEEALGSHQPFFLNEGIADREEERAHGRDRLSRSDWRRLLDAERDASSIPLAAIVRGFGGLEGKRALLAYLESRAVVELVEREHPGAIGRWLARCKAGEPWEAAFVEETGWDLVDLERELSTEIASRFASSPRLSQLSGAQ